MTDWRGLANALHAELGSWQAVAEWCQVNGRGPSKAAYWKVAHGRIHKPSRRLQKCLRFGRSKLPESHQSYVTGGYTQDTRKTVHIRPDDFAAGNLARKRSGLTWPELLHEWRVGAEEVEG